MDAIRCLGHHSTEQVHEDGFFSNENYSYVREGKEGEEKERKGTTCF